MSQKLEEYWNSVESTAADDEFIILDLYFTITDGRIDFYRLHNKPENAQQIVANKHDWDGWSHAWFFNIEEISKGGNPTGWHFQFDGVTFDPTLEDAIMNTFTGDGQARDVPANSVDFATLNFVTHPFGEFPYLFNELPEGLRTMYMGLVEKKIEVQMESNANASKISLMTQEIVSPSISAIELADIELKQQVLLANSIGDETILYGPRKCGGLTHTTNDGYELHLNYLARSPDNTKETEFVWIKDEIKSVPYIFDSKWYTESEVIDWARNIANEEGVPSHMSRFTWMLATAKINFSIPSHADVIPLSESSILSTGTKEINGASVTLSKNHDGSIQIDRIEVPVEKRCKGLASAAINKLTLESIKSGVVLSASICPDSDQLTISDGLLRVFSRAGFLPLAMDGCVYRKDVTFYPERMNSIKFHTHGIDPAMAGKTYIGKIVEVHDSSNLIIQDVGRRKHIAHNSENLDLTLFEGIKLSIAYDANRCGKVSAFRNTRSCAIDR